MTNPLYLTSMLLLVATGLYAPLASADQLSKALAECRQQQNALKRLVCYDEISITTATTPPAKAAPESTAMKSTAMKSTAMKSTAVEADIQVAAAAPKPATDPSAAAGQNFGLEHKNTVEKQADKLYLTVSSINYSPRKELIVEFDNGQVWRQNGSGFYHIKVGERHFIKRGVLNSFSLGNDEKNRTIKVRRVE